MTKVIFLTGGSGMVGRNILNHNEAKNYEILSPNSSNLNLLNYKDLENFIYNNKPDIIIHAAGTVGGIQANIENPVKFFVENIQMGINILTASKALKVKNLINLSSSCVYPRYSDKPLSEDQMLKGELEPTNEGYALAKISLTKLCEYINRENEFFSYKTIIPCNLYGKYDNFNNNTSHMIAGVIKKIHYAKKNNLEFVDIWGDGLVKREFMYAADFADFIYFAIKKFSLMPQNINVGIGKDYTINDYYRIIGKTIGFKGKFKNDLSKPMGMKKKLINNKKLKEFGWSPITSLEQGIKKVYEYYLNEVEK
jgi:GDP-L-fucose synthase